MSVNDKGFIRENCITHFDSGFVELGDIVVPVNNWNYFFQQEMLDAMMLSIYQVCAIDTSRPDSYGLVRIGRNPKSEKVIWVRDIYRFGSREEILKAGFQRKIAEIYDRQKDFRGACE